MPYLNREDTKTECWDLWKNRMRILIVEDETAARYGMVKCLRGPGREISEAENGEDALTQIRQQSPDLVFLDLNIPVRDGVSILQELASDASAPKPEIIVVTANDSVSHAVQCIRLGAADFVTKPFEVDHLRALARRSEERVQLQHRVWELQTQLEGSAGYGRILGASRPMQRLFDQISRAARVNLPVLIRGESGTGKELVAQELHARSPRSAGPFIAVNTAAIAESLVESELFGHVKGAFTGAERPREGVFRQADGGTLFLDEIGDMPLNVQTRLLRVLQEGVVQPVGTEELIRVDVRVISATHQGLEQAIADKLFRQDLYFRLRGIELAIPPLRARREDILPLAMEFLGPDSSFSNQAVTALVNHLWPGNVRELKQRVQSAAAMAESSCISVADLGLVPDAEQVQTDAFESYYDLPLTEARHLLVENFERAAISRALSAQNGNVSAAARSLGVHRQSLQQKMKQLGMTSE